METENIVKSIQNIEDNILSVQGDICTGLYSNIIEISTNLQNNIDKMNIQLNFNISNINSDNEPKFIRLGFS